MNREFFFSFVRGQLFGGKLKPSQVDGLTAILNYWDAHLAAKDDRWLAYALGTAYHETDKTIGPIREYGLGKNKPYGVPVPPPNGPIYYGRGLVQLTWVDNYKKMGAKIGKDLVADPDLALKLENAVPIMFIGMEQGLFTGVGFAKFFNPTTENWVGARKIINGTDKAQLIAGHAQMFYAAISHTI